MKILLRQKFTLKRLLASQQVGGTRENRRFLSIQRDEMAMIYCLTIAALGKTGLDSHFQSSGNKG